MNRFGSHPNHENHPLYEGLPHQGISEARRAGSFLVTNPPRGALSGRQHSSHQMNKGVTIPVSKLYTMI